jgi:hypothetical protein
MEYVFGGSMESGGRYCVCALVRYLSSGSVKIFSHLIHFYKKWYTFCTFSGDLKKIMMQ